MELKSCCIVDCFYNEITDKYFSRVSNIPEIIENDNKINNLYVEAIIAYAYSVVNCTPTTLKYF